MKKNKIFDLTFGAIIASSYILLTLLSNAFGLASSVIQFRLSECLTVFSYLGGYQIIGLTIGCLLSNILIGANVLDILFGTLATLIGAIGTYYIYKVNKKLIFLPPVIANSLIVPIMLRFVYNIEGSYIFFVITVLLGEIVTVGILGMLLNKALEGKIKWIEKK